MSATSVTIWVSLVTPQHAEYFVVAVRVHAGGDHDDGVDHPPVFTHFHGQCVGGDERERARIAQGPVRNTVTCSSRSAAIRETCDFDREWIPSVLTSLSMRRWRPRRGSNRRRR